MTGLTKKQAIELHRDMWNCIADEIERSKKVLDIFGLKRRYCKTAGFGRVMFNCFLCEYAGHVAESYANMCSYCPLEWESKFNEFMCEHNINAGDGLWLKCCDAETWQEQAALARQIANLPER